MNSVAREEIRLLAQGQVDDAHEEWLQLSSVTLYERSLQFEQSIRWAIRLFGSLNCVRE